MARALGNLQFGAYLAGCSSLLAVMLDERFDIRKWKRVDYDVTQRREGASTVRLSVQCRTRPPPIGCMEWPAGRILLQWALDEAGVADESERGSGAVLELGAGIGITAIGLAMARRQNGVAPSASTRVVATDVCDGTLALLRSNAAAHGLDEDALRIANWDAARGEASLATLPCRLEDVTHVVGADVVYYGFGVNNPSDNSETVESHGYPERVGFPHTLAALLREKPSLRVCLLTADRFSGGMVAAVAATAGVYQPSTTVDPAIAAFVRSCEELGLDVCRTPLPPRVASDVAASQSVLARSVWWLAGHYDGMRIRHSRAARRLFAARPHPHPRPRAPSPSRPPRHAAAHGDAGTAGAAQVRARASRRARGRRLRPHGRLAHRRGAVHAHRARLRSVRGGIRQVAGGAEATLHQGRADHVLRARGLARRSDGRADSSRAAARVAPATWYVVVGSGVQLHRAVRSYR